MFSKFGIGVCLLIGAWLLMIAPSGALGGPAPKKMGAAPVALAEKVFLIDDFESGSIKSPRDWWTFDIEKAELVAGNESKYALQLAGTARSWYAGGCGTYLAKEGQDLTKYNTFSLDINGAGPGSGTLKVELYDDDNNNWQVEQDPAKNYVPVYDDKFTYDVRVDWTGWKRVSIPLADFIDDNPLVGDDIWNPQVQGASGGLLQLQFVCLGASEKGKTNIIADNILLTSSETE